MTACSRAEGVNPIACSCPPPLAVDGEETGAILPAGGHRGDQILLLEKHKMPSSPACPLRMGTLSTPDPCLPSLHQSSELPLGRQWIYWAVSPTRKGTSSEETKIHLPSATLALSRFVLDNNHHKSCALK